VAKNQGVSEEQTPPLEKESRIEERGGLEKRKKHRKKKSRKQKKKGLRGRMEQQVADLSPRQYSRSPKVLCCCSREKKLGEKKEKKALKNSRRSGRL